jgi:magnesium chelatase subunit D
MDDNGAAAGHREGRIAAELDVVVAPGRSGVLSQGLWAGTADAEAEAAESSEPDARPRARTTAGRSRLRAVTSPDPFRGRYARAKAAEGRTTDIAWDATLRAVAVRVPHRLGVADLLVKVRVRRPAQLLLFVVDASGSMGGVLTDYARRMAAAVLSDAYLKRAAVAMIAFRERSAELVLGATRKVDRVHRAIDALPLGGTTPLAAALELARRTLERELAKAHGIRPKLILISDGRANVGSRAGHESVTAEVRAAARGLAELTALRVLFLDTTEAGKDDRRARALESWLGAKRLSLAKLTAAGRDPAALAAIISEG